MSVLDKIGLLIDANLNDLVNQALKANDVKVLKLQLERMQDARANAVEELAGVKATISAETRANEGLDRMIAQLAAQINTLVAAGSDEAAKRLIVQKQQKTAEESASTGALDRYTTVANQLAKARDALDAKISQTQLLVNKVEAAQKVAKVTGTALRSFKDIERVLAAASGGEDILRRAEESAEKNSILLQDAVQSSGTIVDPATDPLVEAELAAIKANLGK